MSTDARIDTASGGTHRQQRARRLVRVAVLITAVLLLTAAPGESRVAVVIPALSPLTAIASLLATRVFLVTTWIGLSVGIIVLIRRRWFCRWACPTGTCADGAVKLGAGLHRRCPRLPPLGQWIALLTVGGAVLGYPLLLWLDPLALFSGLFGILNVGTVPGAQWCALGMVAVLALSFIWPGAWCSRICPLGALQDVTFRFTHAVRSAVVRPRESTRQTTANGMPRRVVLATVVGVFWAAAVRRIRAASPPPLRPPGAVGDDRFVQLCIRCGNCQRACPTKIIRPDHGDHGIRGLLAPIVEFRDDYCSEDCTRCTHVCPSGALVPIASHDKKRASIGLPRVNMDLCLLGDDRECSVCRNWCPYEAITLEFSEVEYTLTPRIDPLKCPGCGACEVACPTTPTKAIVIYPR